MNEDYETVSEYQEAVLEFKNSTFIACLLPCPYEESVQENLYKVRLLHPNATHYCYAALYDGLSRSERFSDNGEPSGTAGRPILYVLRGSGLRDAMVVVVRYFGGTLLGTGGLVQAYTETSKAVLDNCSRKFKKKCVNYTIVFDYTYLRNTENLLKPICIGKTETDYAERVTMKINLPLESEELFLIGMRDRTSDTATVSRNVERYVTDV